MYTVRKQYSNNPLFYLKSGILFFLAVFLFTETFSQEYRFFRHKISNRGASVTAATQSGTGYMWFGTDSGLYRHNGTDALFFAFPPEAGRLGAFCFDADTGYVGFADGTVYDFSNGRFTPMKWLEGFPKSGITRIKKDRSGNLWIGTKTEGIYVHDGRYLFHFGTEDGLPDLAINDLVYDPAGYVWAATDRGVARLGFRGRKKSVRTLGTAQGLPDQLVTCLATAGNVIYGGTHSGVLFSVNPTDLKVTLPALPVPAQKPLTDLWADETEIWALDASGGLYMYAPARGNEFIYIESQKIGAEGRIRSITGDDEYNIWLTDGTENVLRIFRGLLYMSEHEAVSLRKISSISCDRNGYVYLASEEGLLGHPVTLSPGHVFKRLGHGGGNAHRQMVSVYADGRGHVWAGTFGNGMLAVDAASGKVTGFTEAAGFLNDNVLGIAGHRGAVWAATLGGIALLPDGLGGAIQSIGRQNGMPVGFNYCVGIDTVSGSAWVGTDGGGLVEIKKDFSVHPVSGGPSTVYSLAVFPGLGVVFSGQQPGLWGYDGRRVFNFSHSFHFGGIAPTGLAMLPDSSVVVLHAQGFERFYPFRKSNTSFGESYGIGSFENALNALSVDEYGNCWLASDADLIRLSHINGRYRKAPKTVLDEILVLSKPIVPGQHEFAYNNNAVMFRFSGLWFQDQKSVTFSYKMDGIDNDWIQTGDHFANYPALPPGKYTFRVKSSATGSFMHPHEVSYAFEIRPPFWQRPWFYVSLTVAVLLAFYLFVKLRDKRVADRERMLKENAEFRFQVLKNQISPHFLFNSFNTLLYLIDSDKRKASGYTEELSDFFRKVLEVREQNLISLREELDLMRAYASLQQTRFENALSMRIDVPDEFLDTLIPPLSGQMLLENAIKHNSFGAEHPLVFRVAIDAAGARLIFANNKRMRRGPIESTGIGLKNIFQRYRLLGFPEPRIEQSDETFTVLLPLVT